MCRTSSIGDRHLVDVPFEVGLRDDERLATDRLVVEVDLRLERRARLPASSAMTPDAELPCCTRSPTAMTARPATVLGVIEAGGARDTGVPGRLAAALGAKRVVVERTRCAASADASRRRELPHWLPPPSECMNERPELRTLIVMRCSSIVLGNRDEEARRLDGMNSPLRRRSSACVR